MYNVQVHIITIYIINCAINSCSCTSTMKKNVILVFIYRISNELVKQPYGSDLANLHGYFFISRCRLGSGTTGYMAKPMAAIGMWLPCEGFVAFSQL